MALCSSGEFSSAHGAIASTKKSTRQSANVVAVTMDVALHAADKDVFYVNRIDVQIHGELAGIKQYVHVIVIPLHQCKGRTTSAAAGCQRWSW